MMVEFSPALIKKGTNLLKKTKNAFPTERIVKFAAIIPNDLALTEGKRMVGQTLLGKVRQLHPEFDRRSASAKKHKKSSLASGWKSPEDLARSMSGFTQEEAMQGARMLAAIATVMKEVGATLNSVAGDVLKPKDWVNLHTMFVALPTPESPKKKAEKKKTETKPENVIHL